MAVNSIPPGAPQMWSRGPAPLPGMPGNAGSPMIQPSAGYSAPSALPAPLTQSPIGMGMGGADGGPAMMGNPYQMNSLQTNPYLQAQGAALAQQSNQNLFNNVLPQVNSGAVAAGGFGGSRQGIAQGLAMGQASQGLSNSLANLYGNAYQQDRALQNQMDISRMQDATAQRGQSLNYDVGIQGIGQQRYATDVGAQTAMRGQDLQTGLGYSGLQNQFNIANLQNQTAMRGQDQNYNLGLGNLGINQYQAQTARDLGYGNLGLGYFNANNNYNLGLGGLQNQRYGMDQNFYTQQRGLDQSGMRLGADLFQMANAGLAGQGQGLYNAGLGQYNAGLMPYQSYGNMLSPFTGYGNSNTTTTPGGNWLGNAIGGGLAGAQFGNLFGRP